MSGVRTGTRLEQLHKLAARIQLEIEAELRRHVPPARPKPEKPATQQTRVDERLRELGVTSRDVKQWAVQAGLRSHVQRGRVSLELVNAYALHRRCECVGYTIRTDYGTGVEYDVDRSSCPVHGSDE